jgi:tetratricopeptide (TPR) repeat protein
MHLGNAGLIHGNYKLAVNYYKKAIEIDPSYFTAYVKASALLRKLKYFEIAESLVNSGLIHINEPHEYAILLREKGFALAGQLKLIKASEVLQKCVSLGQSYDCFYQAVKIISSSNQRFDLAKQFLSLSNKFITICVGGANNLSGFHYKFNTSLNVARFNWQRDFELAKDLKEATLLDVSPRESNEILTKKISNLSDFSLPNDYSQPCLFLLENKNSVNLNPEFNDVQGLLSEEFHHLYVKGTFNQPFYSKVQHSLYVIPRAYFSLSSSKQCKIVSLDGYYISSVMGHWYPITFSNQCLIKQLKHEEDIVYATPAIGQKNLYHFMIEVVASLMFYTRLGLNSSIIFEQSLNSLQLDFLKALNIPQNKILAANQVDETSFKQAIVCRPAGVDKLVASAYRELAHSILSRNSSPSQQKTYRPDRIYISRRKAAYRPCVNEGEIEQSLSNLNFHICYAEDLSLSEKVSIMYYASIVVSPFGAGLTNTVFCREGTKIVELIPKTFNLNIYFQLAIVFGFSYYPVLGSVIETLEIKDTHSDKWENSYQWSVDITKLLKLLDVLL